MQVQKEEVRQRILTAARVEFKKRGYKHALMRSIAARARVTPGNIYSYFPGKEALFAAIVSPAAEAMRRIYDLDIMAAPGALPGALPGHLLEQISEEIVDLFLRHGDDFLLLLDGSEGSAYEQSREQLASIISQRIEEFVFPRFPLEQRDKLLAQAWAEALLAGLLSLLRGAFNDAGRLRRNVSLFLSRMFPEEAL